ncbi:MAG TPA: cyclopropane-fatty-acyl-phospholipid synthase family protein [Nocardioides sp.]|nr:cyclopropane-fatty-acyl-phospholipid synthase family protein [Nocardioides sp.]
MAAGHTLRASATGVADLLADLLGGDLPVQVTAYDGSRSGPASAPATIDVRRPEALRRLLGAPGQLGLSRAYVAGDLEVVGDVYAVLALQDRLTGVRPGRTQLADLTRLLRVPGVVGKPLPPPPEEARLRGRRHSRRRDAAAVTHHYDVSNDFYRLVLGPSMTYSCAVWSDPGVGLEAAQEAKHELVCRKLGLREGMRLLDVGCGWGGLVLHAARRHGVSATGITLSPEQAELARDRVREAGLADRVEIRLQDYRDVPDGPYDAVASVGMVEHVGEAHLPEYFATLRSLLAPGGRLLNHGIATPAGRTAMKDPRGFIQRYVFPDGELPEVGTVVRAAQHSGLEVRHLENLREHYALTLRAWVANLEAEHDRAVELVGPARARIWRLYMAGSALGFEAGHVEVHQLLATRADAGRSGMPLRPDW